MQDNLLLEIEIRDVIFYVSAASRVVAANHGNCHNNDHIINNGFVLTSHWDEIFFCRDLEGYVSFARFFRSFCLTIIFSLLMNDTSLLQLAMFIFLAAVSLLALLAGPAKAAGPLPQSLYSSGLTGMDMVKMLATAVKVHRSDFVYFILDLVQPTLVQLETPAIQMIVSR